MIMSIGMIFMSKELVVTGVRLLISLRLHILLCSLVSILVSIISVQCDRNYFHYSDLSVFSVTLLTLYQTDWVPTHFSVISVQGSELPKVQPVVWVLSLFSHVPV